MRAAALAALVLALAGCGGSSAQKAGGLDNDAAQLVPANAIAFVSADSHFDSARWRTIFDLTGPVNLTPELKAAVGDQLNVASVPSADGPEVAAIVKPKDEAKLRSFAAKKHYTVQHVNGWSIVADSPDVFAAVRKAASGRSLADVADFKTAAAELDKNALATAYAQGPALKQIGGTAAQLLNVAGSPKWIAAQLVPEHNAARLEVRTAAPTGLETKLPALQKYIPASLLPALRGEGVIYLAPATIVPTFVFEVQSPDPTTAEQALKATATVLQARLQGALTLRVARYGSRVVLTNAPANTPSSGGALVNDQPYKDATAAAGVPDDVTFLAYADVQ